MCRALARVLAPPPSILGLLPPPSLLRMLVSLALGSVIPGLLLDWLLLRSWWFGGFVFVGVIESLMWRCLGLHGSNGISTLAFGGVSAFDWLWLYPSFVL
ncbi:unnamed protein product [Prunus armeniaca]